MGGMYGKYIFVVEMDKKGLGKKWEGIDNF